MNLPTLSQLEPIVRRAGALLLQRHRQRPELEVQNKGPHDFVTSVDLELERMLLSELRQRWPEIGVLAEESGHHPIAGAHAEELTWIVDPLDGTSNFIHGIPFCAVSVALGRKNRKHWEILLGVVDNPLQNHFFSAARGRGATLNGKTLQVKPAPPLSKAFLATGFPIRYADVLDLYLNSFAHLTRNCGGVRRLGSAALDLCYTAAGWFHGFWEPHLAPWDVAAGSLILSEAGGKVVDFRGGNRFVETGNIIGGDPSLVEELQARVRNWF